MAWMAKAALPVLLVVGGVAAWAFSSPSEAGTVPMAWIDAPVAGAVFADPMVRVQAHASARGGVDRVELVVDGKSSATVQPTGDDRLSRAEFDWHAPTGRHVLEVRAQAGGNWGPLSSPTQVTVGSTDAPATTIVAGSPSSTTTVVDGSTTTTSSTTTTIASPDAPSTTRPDRTVPPTTGRPSGTVTTVRPLPPLREPALSVSTDWEWTYVPVPITAFTDLESAYTLRVEARRQGTGWKSLFSCSGSPCKGSPSFDTAGNYEIRATLTTGDGRSATSTISSLQIMNSKD